MWGYENIEQIEIAIVFFLDLCLAEKKCPKAFVYGELGQQELKFTVWHRKATFWKRLSHDKKSREFDVSVN